jgi:DNA-binding response OmpR family regulator
MKLLIVDDEKNIRTSLARFFDLHSYSVVAAETGAGAIEQIRNSTFDTVLLDLKLPDVDGIQVLERIKEVADKFVLVRLTRIDNLDLRLFELDYDLTMMIFFLNSEEKVYARYCG